MQNYGEITELADLKLRTSSDNKVVSLLVPTTLAGASLSITTPNVATGTTETLLGRLSTDTGSNRLQNKDLSVDTVSLVDPSDTTKKVKFVLSGFTTGHTSTLTVPDLNGTDTLTTIAATQTLTNKTLTLPTITVKANVLTIEDQTDVTKIVKFDASALTTGHASTLTVPELNGSDTLVTLAATQTLTNKTLTSPLINNPTLNVHDNSMSIQYAGDTTKVVKFDASGLTTGHTTTLAVPEVNGTDTLTLLAATQTLTNKTFTSPVINTPTITVKANVLTIEDQTDITKVVKFDASGLTTGHTSTLVVPELNGSDTLVTLAKAQTLTNKTLTSPTLTTPVLGTPSSGNATNMSGQTTPTASTVAAWDANKNLSAVNLIEGYTTTATAAGTSTLAVGSNFLQYFTGSTTQTVVLPVASTLVLGQQFQIVNNSSGVVTVQSSGANTIQAMASGTYSTFTCILTSGTTAASWANSYATTSAAVSGATPTVAGIVTTFVPTIASAVKAVSSANYTGLTTDGYDTILFTTSSSNRTFTTPAVANSAGRKFRIQKADTASGNVTLVLADGSLIGPASLTCSSQGDYFDILCDGSNWYVGDCYEVYTTTSALTFTGGSGQPATQSTKIIRKHNTVLWSLLFTSITINTTTTLDITGWPSRFRPGTSTDCAGGYAAGTPTGYPTPVKVTSAGTISLYKDNSNNFTNTNTVSSGNAGGDFLSFSYNI